MFFLKKGFYIAVKGVISYLMSRITQKLLQNLDIFLGVKSKKKDGKGRLYPVFFVQTRQRPQLWEYDGS